MTTVGSYDARTHLAELLRRGAQGEDITITRRGVPVAKLVPVGAQAPAESPKKLTTSEAIDAIREFRKGHTLGGLSICEMIDKGCRF
jgi:prevent-host-death family protein